MAVTLICIGIPVCRPLYKRAFRRLFGEISSAGYHKQSGDGSNSHPLRTIGGGLIGVDGKPLPKKKQASTNNNSGADGADDEDLSFSDVKVGVNGPFTRTTVGRGRRNSVAGNTSDEEILDEYRRNVHIAGGSDEEVGRGGARSEPDHGGIMVTETYHVERS